MSIGDELEKLRSLHASGALNDAEYASAKARVIGQAPPATDTGNFLHRLTRSSSDRVLGGVCGGLGAHTGLPSWAWRVMFVITLLYFGVGVLFYLLMWIFIPPEAPPP
ncbi:MAG TPA: PspC domain-containing protein [Steroidobacteraceae bacterium]|nr:PspC domain-containing protein [Steroidobacteraceae bacterium]